MIEETAPTLGSFLRSRRAAVDADELGLASYGRRRVPGLRREELAELAGVSVNYLTRLEQGAAVNASDEILNALARALRLSEVERLHLLELAHPSGERAAPIDRAGAGFTGVRQLVEAMDTPAVVLSRNQDVLAWNRLGNAVLAAHVPYGAVHDDPPPNKVRQTFLDPQVRSLYVDWEHEAELSVASLRWVSAQFPADPDLRALLGELVLDRDFARLWARQSVELCTSGLKRFTHPWVGRMDLCYQMLHLPESDGARMIAFSAAPGSADDDALALLRHRVDG
ncbi:MULTISPECIES: helix-turn-helix domain-containing protein [Tsukamurella]|uniref:Helix-turn-helix transcriptional regulator n=1 Tax=Tsukamurella strandjordii TaxID=147577 RepID=A0AA90NBD9_9ACTN|nr:MULTISPECIES: helix-turn-helix transcriptional regulator [Tsukamurella]MDP0397332.1 helix-turn-helix transcriptional regulator [Tsukamurella strandjordii]GIZ98761.1 transcriptional regulator [Tsukamurella sp. TY48]